MAFYYTNQYDTPLFNNLGNAIFTDLTLKGPIILYGEMGTLGQVLVAQGGNVAPRWTTLTPATTNLTFTGAGTPFTLVSSSGTDVTFAAGTGITLTRSSNELTISATGAADGNGIYGGSGTIPTTTTSTITDTFNIAYVGANPAIYVNDAANQTTLNSKDGAMFIGVNNAGISIGDSLVSEFLSITPTGSIYTSAISGKGIEYFADYSATYSSRSLVDKAYADTKASATAYTLAGVSVLSTDATKSLYTMTSTIPIEFKRSGGTSLLYLDETNGFVGIGLTTPDRQLHVEIADAVTNTYSTALRLSHITSGTATTNFGVGIEYELENASGTNRVAATEEFTWSDATDASEDTYYVLKLMRAGTLTSALTITSSAAVNVSGALGITGNLNLDSSTVISWLSSSQIRNSSDGVIKLNNAANTGFDRLQFGGTTSSFPALKRSTTGLISRLADDSADTWFQAAYYVGSTQALSGPGAANVTTETTKITSTGVLDAISLADGVNGQTKTILHDVDGGSFVLTPTTKTGWTTFTSTAAGESITLRFVTTRGWIVIGSYLGVIA